MVYKLEDGTRVRVVQDGDDVTYEVYRFISEKETVRQGRLTGDEARAYVSALTVADALRFARQYGTRASVDQTRTDAPDLRRCVQEFGRNFPRLKVRA
jgi:hypothetical protein